MDNMRNFYFFRNMLIAVVLTSAALSCADRNKQQNEETKYMTAKECAVDTVFLDVDIADIQNYLLTPSVKSPDAGAQIEKAKAAVYRFYSHVTVENRQYVCDIESGKQINMSEATFSALLNNLNNMNSAIKEISERGDSIFIQPITEEYLNSLLE